MKLGRRQKRILKRKLKRIAGDVVAVIVGAGMFGNGWETPKAAPDQTVTPAVQEAMYDAIFGVMQGTYSPKDALKNMDSAAAN